MNSFLQFVCVILLIQYIKASPARGYNYFDFLYDDFEDNNIGSDSIDVSSLGPEAYGLPNTESGKLLSIIIIILVIYDNLVPKRYLFHIWHLCNVCQTWDTPLYGGIC